jgi:Leucine-rich repeat (LRR) protein
LNLDCDLCVHVQVPAALTHLQSLRVLDLSYNRLSTLSLATLSAIRGLQHLNLDHNQLTTLAYTEGVPQTGGPNLLQLWNLTLSFNAISR